MYSDRRTNKFEANILETVYTLISWRYIYHLVIRLELYVQVNKVNYNLLTIHVFRDRHYKDQTQEIAEKQEYLIELSVPMSAVMNILVKPGSMRIREVKNMTKITRQRERKAHYGNTV